MGFDMSEVDRLANDLAVAPAKVAAKTPAVEHRTAEAVAHDAEILSPKLTGYLSQNIEVHGSQAIAMARYSGYVEWGTSDTAPQPFMRPAADRNVGTLADGMGDIAEDIL
jgi:HK97 gp10 family phage protein